MKRRQRSAIGRLKFHKASLGAMTTRKKVEAKLRRIVKSGGIENVVLRMMIVGEIGEVESGKRKIMDHKEVDVDMLVGQNSISSQGVIEAREVGDEVVIGMIGDKVYC